MSFWSPRDDTQQSRGQPLQPTISANVRYPLEHIARKPQQITLKGIVMQVERFNCSVEFMLDKGSEREPERIGDTLIPSGTHGVSICNS